MWLDWLDCDLIWLNCASPIGCLSVQYDGHLSHPAVAPLLSGPDIPGHSLGCTSYLLLKPLPSFRSSSISEHIVAPKKVQYIVALGCGEVMLPTTLLVQNICLSSYFFSFRFLLLHFFFFTFCLFFLHSSAASCQLRLTNRIVHLVVIQTDQGWPAMPLGSVCMFPAISDVSRLAFG